jgi:DNA-directed RNA polymerase sigma subunit (sigma70/sigma32)
MPSAAWDPRFACRNFQIEAKALRKLRHPTRSKQLRSFYQ